MTYVSFAVRRALAVLNDNNNDKLAHLLRKIVAGPHGMSTRDFQRLAETLEHIIVLDIRSTGVQAVFCQPEAYYAPGVWIKFTASSTHRVESCTIEPFGDTSALVPFATLELLRCEGIPNNIFPDSDSIPAAFLQRQQVGWSEPDPISALLPRSFIRSNQPNTTTTNCFVKAYEAARASDCSLPTLTIQVGNGGVTLGHLQCFADASGVGMALVEANQPTHHAPRILAAALPHTRACNKLLRVEVDVECTHVYRISAWPATHRFTKASSFSAIPLSLKSSSGSVSEEKTTDSENAAPFQSILRSRRAKQLYAGAKRVARDPRTRAIAKGMARTALGTRYDALEGIVSAYQPRRRAIQYQQDEYDGTMKEQQKKKQLAMAKQKAIGSVKAGTGKEASEASKNAVVKKTQAPTQNQNVGNKGVAKNSKPRPVNTKLQIKEVTRPKPQGLKTTNLPVAKQTLSDRFAKMSQGTQAPVLPLAGLFEKNLKLINQHKNFSQAKTKRFAVFLTRKGRTFDPRYRSRREDVGMMAETAKKNKVCTAEVGGIQQHLLSSFVPLICQVKPEVWTTLLEKNLTNDIVIDTGSNKTYWPIAGLRKLPISGHVELIHDEKIPFSIVSGVRFWSNDWVHVGLDSLLDEAGQEFSKQPTRIVDCDQGEIEVHLDTGATVNITSLAPTHRLLKPVLVNGINYSEATLIAGTMYIHIPSSRLTIMSATAIDPVHKIMFGVPHTVKRAAVKMTSDESDIAVVKAPLDWADYPVDECNDHSVGMMREDGADPVLDIGGGTPGETLPTMFTSNMDAALQPESMRIATASGMDFVSCMKGEAIKEPVGLAVTYAGITKNLFGAMCMPNSRGICTLTNRKMLRAVVCGAKAENDQMRSDAAFNDGSRVTYGAHSHYYVAGFSTGVSDTLFPICFVPSKTAYASNGSSLFGVTPLRDATGNVLQNSSEPTQAGNIQRCGTTPIGQFIKTTDSIFVDFEITWRQGSAVTPTIAMELVCWYLEPDGSYSSFPQLITTSGSSGAAAGTLFYNPPHTADRLLLGVEARARVLVAGFAFFGFITIERIRVTIVPSAISANLEPAAPYQCWTCDVVPSISQVQAGDSSTMAGRWTANRLFVSNTTATGFSSGNSVSLVCPYGDPFVWCGLNPTLAERIPGTKSRPITEGANLVADQVGFLIGGGWDSAFDEVPRREQGQTCIFLAELPNIVNGTPSLRYAYYLNFEVITAVQALNPRSTIYSARMYEQISCLFADGAINSSNPKHKTTVRRRAEKALALLRMVMQ